MLVNTDQDRMYGSTRQTFMRECLAGGRILRAILYPTRAALADALRRLTATAIPLDGATSDFRWLLREGHCIELETMPHETVTEPPGDLGLETLDRGASKLYHLARIQVDEVIMVLLRRFLVTGSAVTERMPLQNAG